MEREEFFTKLFEKVHKIGIDLTEKNMEQFYNYMNLLLEWNEKINLTAITEPNDIILKHFIDSVTINKYLFDKNKIIDIGTGAGFPGIPLKILNEEKEFTLVDSLNKRISFLNEVKKELDLKYLNCIHGRVEEVARNKEFREKFDVITSRAVARLNILAEYMLPFIEIGGICICMKGSEIEEELEEAKKAIKVLGGEIEKVEHFYLDDTDIERNIVIIRKVSTTPKQYPRKAGTPAKQPIV